MIHENLLYACEHFGPVSQVRSATSDEIVRLYEILPEPLANFIENRGFCSFHDGLFTMCHPDEMRPLLSLIFKGDNEFHHNDCHVVGYTAFGELLCWSERFWDFEIDLPLSAIFCQTLTQPDLVYTAKVDHVASSIIRRHDFFDFEDIFDEPMYKRCQKAHGRLKHGECYGFVPALALAGYYSPMRTVDHIQRIQAREHFAILAQLDTFHLMTLTKDGFEPQRPIG